MKHNFTLKKFLTITISCFSLMVCLFHADIVQAATSSKTWNVYGQSGVYNQRQIVSIPNFGFGYVATCSNKSGNATYKCVNILEYSDSNCSKNVSLNKTVRFTDPGSVTFCHKNIPAVNVVYMDVKLTYSNGTSAGMSGTIRTND